MSKKAQKPVRLFYSFLDLFSWNLDHFMALYYNSVFFFVSGLVLYNGTLVNVEKLMERIKAAERALLDSEQVVADLKKENVDLSAAHTKSQSKIKDLTSDVNSVTRKLDSLAGMQKKNSEYLSVFASINEKIAPFLVKKEKERSTP